MPILGDFAVKYGAYGPQLGVPMDDLYQALIDTAENTPSNWYEGKYTHPPFYVVKVKVIVCSGTTEHGVEALRLYSYELDGSEWGDWVTDERSFAD